MNGRPYNYTIYDKYINIYIYIWHLFETCLGKIDQLMLIRQVHRSTLMGTRTFQSICFRKIENSLHYVCPARARGAWYFWIGWSDCLNQGTKRFVSIRATSIAQITLPNCLLTTTNGQKQSNLMIFELSQPNLGPATFKYSYIRNARCQRHKFGSKRTVSLSRTTYNHI